MSLPHGAGGWSEVYDQVLSGRTTYFLDLWDFVYILLINFMMSAIVGEQDKQQPLFIRGIALWHLWVCIIHRNCPVMM